MPKCYDGRRHRWVTRLRWPRQVEELWCRRCGEWKLDVLAGSPRRGADEELLMVVDI